MWATLLDLLFDLLIERGLLRLGAGILWLADGGRVPYPVELERGRAALAAGLLALLAPVGAWLAWVLWPG